jgi:hypothetical protein
LIVRLTRRQWRHHGGCRHGHADCRRDGAIVERRRRRLSVCKPCRCCRWRHERGRDNSAPRRTRLEPRLGHGERGGRGKAAKAVMSSSHGCVARAVRDATMSMHARPPQTASSRHRATGAGASTTLTLPARSTGASARCARGSSMQDRRCSRPQRHRRLLVP